MIIGDASRSYDATPHMDNNMNNTLIGPMIGFMAPNHIKSFSVLRHDSLYIGRATRSLTRDAHRPESSARPPIKLIGVLPFLVTSSVFSSWSFEQFFAPIIYQITWLTVHSPQTTLLRFRRSCCMGDLFSAGILVSCNGGIYRFVCCNGGIPTTPQNTYRYRISCRVL